MDDIFCYISTKHPKLFFRKHTSSPTNLLHPAANIYYGNCCWTRNDEECCLLSKNICKNVFVSQLWFIKQRKTNTVVIPLFLQWIIYVCLLIQNLIADTLINYWNLQFPDLPPLFLTTRWQSSSIPTGTFFFLWQITAKSLQKHAQFKISRVCEDL